MAEKKEKEQVVSEEAEVENVQVEEPAEASDGI